MGKAEQYRHYGTECVRLARQTDDPHEKEILLGMAEAWRRLAERADRPGQDDPVQQKLQF